MTWFMDILNICVEEQLLIKYYGIKHLIMLNIQSVLDISADLLQWFKKSSGGAVKSDIMPNQELAKELQIPIIRTLKNIKYTLL